MCNGLIQRQTMASHLSTSAPQHLSTSAPQHLSTKISNIIRSNDVLCSDRLTTIYIWVHTMRSTIALHLRITDLSFCFQSYLPSKYSSILCESFISYRSHHLSLFNKLLYLEKSSMYNSIYLFKSCRQ